MDMEGLKAAKRYKFTDVSSFRGEWPDVCDFVSAASYDALIAECESLKAEIADPEFPPKYSRRLIAELREECERRDAAHQQELERHRTTFTQLEQAKREIALLKGVSRG
jgi:hypothetical protein